MAGHSRVEWCALSESAAASAASPDSRRVEGQHSLPFVYIARCADGTLYVGHTDDLAARELTHNQGHGARYTAERRPIRIIYSEPFVSTKEATTRERQLKGWTLAKKEALIGGDVRQLKGISRRSRPTRQG
jgi:predicted GIY-YIG superfamily endonuclease